MGTSAFQSMFTIRFLALNLNPVGALALGSLSQVGSITRPLTFDLPEGQRPHGALEKKEKELLQRAGWACPPCQWGEEDLGFLAPSLAHACSLGLSLPQLPRRA